MTEDQFLIGHFEKYRRAIVESDVVADLIALKRRMTGVAQEGRKVIVAGNGGSAAIASHSALDLTRAAGVRCLNFGDASLVTCLANDFGYDRWLVKALELYADEGDLVLLISSSGVSENIVGAAVWARSAGHGVATFTGFAASNPLRSKGDINFWVDSREYNIVEMTHQIWLLALCDLITANRGGSSGSLRGTR